MLALMNLCAGLRIIECLLECRLQGIINSWSELERFKAVLTEILKIKECINYKFNHCQKDPSKLDQVIKVSENRSHKSFHCLENRTECLEKSLIIYLF